MNTFHHGDSFSNLQIMINHYRMVKIITVDHQAIIWYKIIFIIIIIINWAPGSGNKKAKKAAKTAKGVRLLLEDM